MARRKPLSIYLNPEVRAEVEVIAARKRRSLTYLVERWTESGVDREKKRSQQPRSTLARA